MDELDQLLEQMKQLIKQLEEGLITRDEFWSKIADLSARDDFF